MWSANRFSEGTSRFFPLPEIAERIIPDYRKSLLKFALLSFSVEITLLN